MDNKTFVFEGKTTNEAIENGLKSLNVSKSKVDIKVLEQEDKRSFFSILTPRVVKVEMTLKDGVEEVKENNSKEIIKNKNEKSETKVVEFNKDKAEGDLKAFLSEFISKLPGKELDYTINTNDNIINVNIDGEDTGYLIGYRGEVLNNLQTILTNIASKDSNCKVKVLLNIGGYREKREKDLENLANKIAGSVIKTRKSITLEPMSAYERKIIHSKLQSEAQVETVSIGEEPRRRIVISLKK